MVPLTDHSVFDQHAREFEAGFLEDMDALGVRPADVLTRITEYVPQVGDIRRNSEPLPARNTGRRMWRGVYTRQHERAACNMQHAT